MPITYSLIASNTLTTSAASVTFSGIPNTFTDLVLRCSVRGTRANTVDVLYLEFNANTATNYSDTAVSGNGATASSASSTSNTLARFSYIPAANATANTFSTSEAYIPSYTVSQNKPLSVIGAQEDNIVTAYIEAGANLWRNTAAISSIKVLPNNNNFVSGSSFFLYGIKKD